MHDTANGRPDFRQEFDGLSVGISRDGSHQDNIPGRNTLQGREGALDDGKQALSIEVIAKRAQREAYIRQDSPRGGDSFREVQRHSCRGTSG